MPALLRFVVLGISKTFSKLFGLATVTFFGRMPSRDDDKIAAAGLLSLWWVFLPVGIAVPRVAELVVPFLPDDETIVRAVAAALTILLPAVIGWLTTLTVNHAASGRSTVLQVLKGYVYAPIIGVLVIALVIVVPIVKFRRIVQLKEVEHLTMMVREGDLADVTDEVSQALERAGVDVEPATPERSIALLLGGLTWVQSNIFARDVASGMHVLRGELDDEPVEITVHATDIALVGRRDQVSHLVTALNDELSEERLYFTWDEPAQQLEDEILELRHRLDRGDEVAPERIVELVQEIRGLGLDMHEWNALRRHLYTLERDLFKLRAGASLDDANSPN